MNAFNRAADLPKRIARRILREGARRLPVSSQTLGPPRGVLPSTREWCVQNEKLGAHFHAIAPEEKPVLAPPISLEEMPKSYLMQLRAKTPPRFVARIPGGRVCHAGFAITPDDFVLGDVTYQSKLEDLDKRDWPIFQNWKLPSLQKQNGAVGVLASLWADNYYHWLFDVVPRVHLLREIELAQSELKIQKYVVACDKSFQKQTLDLLGISENQRIADQPNLHLRAENLIVPSLPGGQGNPPRWICEFLRETLTTAARREYSQPENSDLPKRIYISRAGAGGRCVANEKEVLEILCARNFEISTLENLSFSEQILLFENADAIVAPHGAALSNLVFCKPQTRVVEFFAPGWIYPVYNFIGAHGDLRFSSLIGKGARPLPENDARFRDADITIDINELKEMLRLLEL